MMILSRRLSRIHNLNFRSLERSLIGVKDHSTILDNSESMAFRDSDRWRFFHQILGFSGVNSRSASQCSASSPGSSSTEDETPGFYFAANEKPNQFRRESTIDDEAKVVALLKEILAYQDTSMSNWIIEVRLLYLRFNFNINFNINIYLLLLRSTSCIFLKQ